ncbi:hypothetical protein C8A05DRAFT_39680 [Staphylotrichum tortipilum]|uniref:Uncharacterized protein n=1 Tax=Staphylotrichum tortipilum TaxID=2831512 RepID=A0AAN6M9I9_9PEZI|nr:hypothetical protein C8A05DRAFT_39680 [Staphylotrichum longicolle]
MDALVLAVRLTGLARWDDLPPVARDIMSEWSPVACQLWESDFDVHQDGLVQAWIWHYLDDNIFWSAGATGAAEGLAPCASPVWEHVRALRRELHVVRTRHSSTPKHRCMDFLRSQSHLVHLQTWGRLTEDLVLDGLGLEGRALEPFSPEQLIPHFKKSLRLLVADGNAKIPDHEDDTDWAPCELFANDGDIHKSVKKMLGCALGMRHFLHGLPAKWMEDCNSSFISRQRPGEDGPPPPVQLVVQPMLVKSGFDRTRNVRGFHLRYPMRTISTWTFDAKDAYPGYRGRLCVQEIRNNSDGSEADNGEVAGGGGGGGRAQDETNGPEEEEEAAKASRGGKADKHTAVAAAPAKAASKRKRSTRKRGAKHIRAK